MPCAAIILCGGRSSRMGRDKALLPFGSELMLQRVTRIVSQVVSPENIVVVAAGEQRLPALSAALTVARDDIAFRGPLAGIATGLHALEVKSPLEADAIFATGCDFPLLVPAIIDRMFELLDNFDAAVPVDGEHHHALTAVYSPNVLPKIENLLAADRLRAQYLFTEVNTHKVPVDALRDVDPTLNSLRNVNSAADYEAALAAAGFPPNRNTPLG